MPANLPPEAKKKWAKVLEAKTPAEKIKALEDFLSAVPKHKGTEKLRRQIKRKIAQLRREMELASKKKAGRISFFIEKEGDLQLVLLGLPNSGKSSLISVLTGVGEYGTSTPFETKKPVPGMLEWEGLKIQLVDTPSIIENASRGAAGGPLVLTMAKNADGILLIIDLSGDPAYQLHVLINELENFNIVLKRKEEKVIIEKTRGGGVVVLGTLEKCTLKDIKEMLKNYGIYNAIIRISGSARLDEIEEAIYETGEYKPALVVATKADISSSKVHMLQKEMKRLKLELPIIVVNVLSLAKEKHKFAELVGQYFLKELGLIRVYTRNPKTGAVAKHPIVLKRGARVIDVAEKIHSSLVKHFKYAKIWSDRLPFSPQKVGLEFVLEDKDIIEIRSKI